MKPYAFVVAGAVLAATSACTPAANTAAPEAAMITEAEAQAAIDAAHAAWVSMDTAKIEAVYAKGIVGFDFADPALSTTFENWHRLQVGFASMKLDHIDVTDRKVQILDGEDFIESGTATFTSKDGPMKTATMRFTDVYRKQADGKFLIVNEHVSAVPTAPAG
ncbi:MAG TPA: DUF4440 domain-containing protein [Novosphingobium sp.]|nr:DUF4440 domain-containing protein [Novosphingobium sp.]